VVTGSGGGSDGGGGGSDDDNGAVMITCAHPVERANEVVNTNGAGDCFAGGFLAAWHLDKDVSTCVQTGALCARLCVRSHDGSMLVDADAARACDHVLTSTTTSKVEQGVLLEHKLSRFRSREHPEDNRTEEKE
jgi:hypothetical protein